jgi:CheY-like chemotaxis protein
MAPSEGKTLEKSVILIVEDEEIIGRATVHIIEDEGYGVVGTSNADCAMMILESRNDILPVFTDIRMPVSMDGMEFARTIQNSWPPIGLVATSSPEKVDKFSADWRYVRKPYASAQIAIALRDLVA